MKLPANLKSMRITWTGPQEVDLVLTLEKVPISALGQLWDLPAGPIRLEIKPAQGRLIDSFQPEETKVPEAFR